MKSRRRLRRRAGRPDPQGDRRRAPGRAAATGRRHRNPRSVTECSPLGRGVSTPQSRPHGRLTASLRDGAGATLVPASTTSSAARTRGMPENGQQDQPLGRGWAVERRRQSRTRRRTRDRSAGQQRCPAAPAHVGESGADEPVCKPDPVPGHLTVHRSATIHLGLPSPAGSSGPPAGSGGQPSNACAAAQ